MLLWVKERIGLIYRWIWYFLLCRTEPFTYQLTRASVRHGIFFWVFFYAVAGWCFSMITGVWIKDVIANFTWDRIWDVLIGVGGLVFLSWLTDHLQDQVREKPGVY